MIEFYTAIKPFKSMETCGDFSVLLENDDHYFFAIGDIGGHGSIAVGKLKEFCEQAIKDHYTMPLSELLHFIHNLKQLKERGMTLFLSRIYKKTPLMEYTGVGNIRILLHRNNVFRELNIQEGIVGYTIPTNINTHLLKLIKGDRVLIATDGVSLHTNQLPGIISLESEITEIAENIVCRCGNQDDRLCSVIKFDLSSSYFLNHNNVYTETSK